MKQKCPCLFFLLLLLNNSLFFFPAVHAQGLIVNEISNGPAGTQEYMEFVVVGAACTNVDISGFIFDDNNGSCNGGFGSKQGSSGVATGHVRFGAVATWQSIPVGSIILVYNPSDKNPGITLSNDPTDSSPKDSVYVLPVNHSSLEGCGTLPAGSPSDCIYSCTYGSGSWSYIGMRNSGDAAQVRNPGGTYYHGISYGSDSYDMTGGPDGLRVLAGDGTGKAFYFNSGDYRNVANFSYGNVGVVETPGAPNNAANNTFIQSLRNCSAAPVTLLSFTASVYERDVNLRWETANEENNSYFHMERKSLHNSWEEWVFVASINAEDNPLEKNVYEYADRQMQAGRYVYRLKQVDIDGSTAYYNLETEIVVAPSGNVTLFQNFPNPFAVATDIKYALPVPAFVSLKIFDMLGREVAGLVNENKEAGFYRISFNAAVLKNGVYFYRLQADGFSETQRMIVVK